MNVILLYKTNIINVVNNKQNILLKIMNIT